MSDDGKATARVPTRQLLGVGCMSAGILLVELGLTRLFSVLMFYHFAFLAISIALLGLSTSGVFVYLTPRLHPRTSLPRQLRAYALLFAGVTIFSAVCLLRIRMASNISDSLRLMFLVYLLGAAPFFAGGACLTLAVSRLHGDINRVYGADLVGAAVGCMLLIPALNYVGGPGSLLVAGGLGASAFFLFTTERKAGLVYLLPLLIVLGALGGQARFKWLDATYAKGTRGRAVKFSKWNSFSRVAVYDESHADWGLSSTYQGPHPKALVMDIDASASTPIIEASSLEDVDFLRYELTAFAHTLLPPRSHVLVIGPGGGRDLWTALLFDAAEVTGVEINPIIVRQIMLGRFHELSGGIYDRRGVHVAVDDGRSFIRRSAEKYDLIQASLIDTWAATAAGAFTLSENNLYTVEAFVDYFRHLKPTGVLTFSRWKDDGLRLMALARAAGEELGWAGLADRLFIIRHANKVDNFIVKNSAFLPAEIESLRNRAASLSFKVVYPPEPGAPQDDLGRLLTTRDSASFYRDFPWDISPTTDDRPFFFHAARLGNVKDLFKSRQALFSSGLSLLVGLLAISTTLVLVFILGPLALLTPSGAPRRGGRLPLGALGYFACLGAGYMLIEIGLMQRFVLFLGHPVYSLTVILFTLLLGGGVGSAISRGLGGAPRRALRVALPAIIVAGIVYAVVLPPLFTTAISLALPLRIGLSVLLLLPLGVLLGMPLPIGVRLLAEERPDVVAWAWGINGATSVVGATLAILLALSFGFTRVAFLGTAIYALALLLGWRMGEQSSGSLVGGQHDLPADVAG